MATLVPPYGVQLLPLNIMDPYQQWTFENGYIVSVAKVCLLFHFTSSSFLIFVYFFNIIIVAQYCV